MNPGAVIFRRYELHEQLGAGGAGTVWRATDQLLHQTVALKRVTVTGLDPEEARLTRDRALREARLAVQLRSHPHVVAVYDALIDAADIWLVMEYLPARSLRELLADADGPLDHAEVARIGTAIADALAAAHDRRIEHRDVKPGNVLIGHDGTIKLTDFGISHLSGDPHLTQSGITGTPAYLAPEVAKNGESSPASDIFSLGATLYAALEGQPPFGTDDNLLQLLKVVRTGIIRPPANAGPLEPLLLRLLHLDPTTRPDAATTRDLLARLHTATAPLQPSRSARWRPRWPPRRPVRRGLAFAAAALILGTTIAFAGPIVLDTVTKDTGEEAAPDTTIAAATQRLRNADPCPLTDLETLTQFGTPERVPGPYLNSCQIDIDNRTGASAQVLVSFDTPTAISSIEGTPAWHNNFALFRKELVEGKRCRNLLLPGGEEPRIYIDARTYDTDDKKPGIDLCRVADVATDTVIAGLERDKGITYTPNRTAHYSHAHADVCTLVDPATLSKVPGLDLSDPSVAYGNWSCLWEQKPDGNSVDVHVRVGDQSTIDSYAAHRDETTIAGKKVLIARDGQSCDIVLLHRITSAGIEILEVELTGPQMLAETRLIRATEIVAAAEENLS